ncbi:MAG: NADH-quinone oxidoreductase subunit J [Geodermatophilaceae bacterium]
MNYTIVLAADAVSTGEAVTFWIVGPIALAGALGMVFSRNAVHSALWLVLTMLGLGVFYFVQQGPFLGAVQIIVYTGAIMILFLFVLMLVGRESSDSVVETLRGQRQAAIVAGVAFAALVGAGIGRAVSGAPVQGLAEVNGNGGNVVAIAEILFTDYLFAFELTSALLITAAVGAMVLAHIERSPANAVPRRTLPRRGTPVRAPGRCQAPESLRRPTQSTPRPCFPTAGWLRTAMPQVWR